MLPIYKRVRDDGRMLPDGLTYIDIGLSQTSVDTFN
jgi:hypothetical protein